MKKLNPIGLLGLLAGVLGSVVIVFAIHSMTKVEEGKETASAIASALSVINPFAGLAGGLLKRKASHYDSTVWMLLTVGIAILLLGIGILYLYQKSSSKKDK